ncbi:hypothetical protein POVWA2_012490 [Plasmodium ovale wallikeri]|uniref:Uncharacterized protein n=1 Tax=Plasmodium ovale wallikeri TaxID=864142 RepID=A0A1A8YNB8_PLAOA|nr:hypothetical protein POVWA1_011790 [Plasmodium ovale wallikeri]SBT33006.1 hypothetical protein POVWA2_012490 [Plasmodium ovale wallikeri]
MCVFFLARVCTLCTKKKRARASLLRLKNYKKKKKRALTFSCENYSLFPPRCTRRTSFEKGKLLCQGPKWFNTRQQTCSRVNICLCSCVDTVAWIPLRGYRCVDTVAWIPLRGYRCVDTVDRLL